MEQVKEKLARKIQRLPISIPLLISIICSYGFIILYSAGGGDLYPWAYKQMIIFATFLPISFLIALIDIRLILRLSYLPYFFVLILLIFVELFGKNAMGATRWINIGPLQLQPSEITKIAVVLMLAKYFHNLKMDQEFKVTNLILPVFAIFVPVILIVKQPDLGTGMVTLIVAVTMLFAAGVNLRYFVITGIAALSLSPVIWHFLHNYQKNRILVFLNPGKEQLGAGYNIIQSQIAIGSGGFFGKGLLSGTQSHLKFLPEYQTDFIFAFLSEELGFLGGFILLILYSLLIFTSLSLAANCKAKFTKLLIVGITTIFFCHIFINIGMVMGLLPVVGVPLPFISYGGTMMVSMLVGFGLVMNGYVNQHSNL